MDKKNVTRRDFLRLAALGPVAAGIACSEGEALPEEMTKNVTPKNTVSKPSGGKAKVVLVMFTPLFHGVGPHHFNKKHTWE